MKKIKINQLNNLALRIDPRTFMFAVILLVVAMNVTLFFGLSNTTDNLKKSEIAVVNALYAKQLELNFNRVTANLKNTIDLDDSIENANFELQSLNQIVSLLSDTANPATQADLREQLAAYQDGINQAMSSASSYMRQLIDGGDEVDAESHAIQIDQLFTELLPLTDQIVDSYLAAQKTTNEHGFASLELVKASTMSLSALITLLLIAFSFIIAGNLTKPVNIMSRFMHKLTEDLELGQCDLGDRVNVKCKGAASEMATNLNQFISKLESIISGVSHSVKELETASDNLNSTATETRNALIEQNQHTDEVATAMNEMASTIHEIAKNAENAASVAHDTVNTTGQGQQIVESSVKAIDKMAAQARSTSDVIMELEKKSESIGAVVDVIKSIAEQTNLLALNAAIEAARAGESGRGFAVVADEVRVLAQRTQDSTRQIEDTVQQLQQGAQNAVTAILSGAETSAVTMQEANKTQEALQLIARAVDDISGLNIQIASASEQQSATTEEINRRVQGIVNITQQTADSSNGTTRSAQQVSDTARHLHQLIAQFKIT